MTCKHLIDPELRLPFEHFPALELNLAGLAASREQGRQLFAAMPRPDLPVEMTNVIIPGHDGAPPVRGLLLTPAALARPAAAILHLHGGGYVLGEPEILLPELMQTAHAAGCLILSVDYRLAPETRAPGAVEDGYAGLEWLFAQATSLGVDPARIAVMGESAGGGLAAALALLARDRGAPPLALQLLDSPALDDRTCTQPPHPVNSEFTWRPEHNHFGWSCLLGEPPGGSGISPYAAAARASDLTGLPPSFLCCGALDLFLDDTLDYARRLARAAVPVELHVYPGAFHGFGMVRESRLAKAALRDKVAALRQALRVAGPAG